MNGAPVFKQKSQNQNSFQETVREVSRIFVRYIWNCWMILADGRVTPCWLNFQRRESPPHISIERKGSFPWQDIYTMYIKNCERFPGHGFQVTLRLRLHLRRSICLCLLVLLINCQKSQMCLRQWQGHLLSCPGQPKNRKNPTKRVTDTLQDFWPDLSRPSRYWSYFPCSDHQYFPLVDHRVPLLLSSCWEPWENYWLYVNEWAGPESHMVPALRDSQLDSGQTSWRPNADWLEHIRPYLGRENEKITRARIWVGTAFIVTVCALSLTLCASQLK